MYFVFEQKSPPLLNSLNGGLKDSINSINRFGAAIEKWKFQVRYFGFFNFLYKIFIIYKTAKLLLNIN